MKPRLLVFAAFLALLAVSAAAVTVELDKSTYFKGQEMGVSGSCTANETVEVSALLGKAKAFTQAVPCGADGKYSLFQTLSFSMPSGKWVVKAAEGAASDSKEAEVQPTKESDYYLITFVSPAPVKHYKTEALTISVKVTESGEPISGAGVVFYDAEGDLKPLEETGLGVYSAEYSLPYNAPGGNWFLYALAEKETDKKYGGANSLVVGVDRADLQLEILEPSIQNFDLGTEIPFKVKAIYSGGKPIVNGTAWMEFNGAKTELQALSSEEGVFTGGFKTKEEHIGSLTFNFVVQDGAQNEGRKAVDMVVTVDRFALFIKNNWLYLVIGLLAAGTAIYVSYSKVRGRLDRKSLLAERAKLREAVRKIQTDYFDKMVIDKNTFKKRLGEAEARLIEIDKSLKSQGAE